MSRHVVEHEGPESEGDQRSNERNVDGDHLVLGWTFVQSLRTIAIYHVFFHSLPPPSRVPEDSRPSLSQDSIRMNPVTMDESSPVRDPRVLTFG